MIGAIEAKLTTLGTPLAVVLPDGRRLGLMSAPVTLHLKELRSLFHLQAGHVGEIAKDYVEGRVDIQGTARDIAAVSAELMQNPVTSMNWFRRALRHLISQLKHTKAADAKQVQFHYDISDEFYALFLDPNRVYSCAYFKNKHWDETQLEQAQEAKLDLICRKLQLQEGDEFLDIGAGWGGLLLHAAENYGVSATGVTLSHNQYIHVKHLINERGFGDGTRGRVKVKLLDYRDLPDEETFDKIASVGMSEHVGTVNLPVYARKLHTLLRPGGLLLNHCITSATTKNKKLGAGLGNFIEKHIFPGGELQHVSHLLRVAADAGLEVLDVENLRPHYARTLWAWSDQLEANLDRARELVGEDVVRAYRMYLAGSAVNFERGLTSLHQILASKPSGDFTEGDLPGAQSPYPFNRKYMYD